MNCITRSRSRILGFVTLYCLVMAPGLGANEALTYGMTYTVRVNPADRSIQVTLDVSQTRALLRSVAMQPDQRISDITGDGDLDVAADGVVWQPPANGGSLRWQVRVDQRRNGAGYDAWLGENWGLFRAEDIIPRAASRTLRGAASDTRLVFDLPTNWSVVTEYFGRKRVYRIANPMRRFDQPSGWIMLGDVGVRRERIAGMRVAVAAPVGQSVRRMDMLALLNWTLPELARLVPELPARLTVFSAAEPMWRGGLSAPQSLYVHADRPLISENATSTLLHEVMHLALGIKAARNHDWIVEGLAEYYSIALLARSGTISAARYTAAMESQRRWGRSAEALCRPSSSGATTALAVHTFGNLDREIRDATAGTASLDDLLRSLSRADERVDLQALRRASEALMGRKSDTLQSDELPGCRNISANRDKNEDH